MPEEGQAADAEEAKCYATYDPYREPDQGRVAQAESHEPLAGRADGGQCADGEQDFPEERDRYATVDDCVANTSYRLLCILFGGAWLIARFGQLPTMGMGERGYNV